MNTQFIYATIDENGVCDGIKYLSDEISDPKSILVNEGFDWINKKWNGTEWINYEPDPEPEPEPTQLDRIEEAVNKSQQDIIDEYTLELIEGGVI